MFDKIRTKRHIKKLRKQIQFVEKKRVRSQGALVEAILTNTTPDDTDVDYFNRYTAEIESLRAEMHQLDEELKTL